MKYDKEKYFEIQRIILDLNGQINPYEFTIINSFLNLMDRVELKQDLNYCLDYCNLIKNEYFINYKAECDKFNELVKQFTTNDYSRLIKDVINNKYDFDQQDFTVVPTLRRLISELLKICDGDCLADIEARFPITVTDMISYVKENKIKLSTINSFWLNNRRGIMKTALLNMAIYLMYGDSYINVIKKDLEEFENLTYNKALCIPELGFTMNKSLENFEPIFFDKSLFNESTCKEWIDIDRVLGNLKENGRAIAMVYSKLLFNDSDKKIRDYLINNGYLEAIIELPRDVYGKVNTTFVLLVFSSKNEKIKLIDASNLSSRKSLQSDAVLNIKTILKMYNDEKGISSSELIHLTNLTPSIALLNIEKPKSGKELEDIADVFYGSQFTLRNFKEYENDRTNEKIKIITPINIENESINYDNLSEINYDGNKFDKYCIQKNDIIITSKSTTFKVGFVDKNIDEKIVVAGGMIIIRVKDKNIIPSFLMKFLNTDRGRNIIKSVSRGATIISIKIAELKKTIIPYNDGEFQNKINNEYLLLDTELKYIEEQIKKLNLRKKTINEHKNLLIDKYFK